MPKGGQLEDQTGDKKDTIKRDATKQGHTRPRLSSLTSSDHLRPGSSRKVIVLN